MSLESIACAAWGHFLENHPAFADLVGHFFPHDGFLEGGAQVSLDTASDEAGKIYQEPYTITNPTSLSEVRSAVSAVEREIGVPQWEKVESVPHFLNRLIDDSKSMLGAVDNLQSTLGDTTILTSKRGEMELLMARLQSQEDALRAIVAQMERSAITGDDAERLVRTAQQELALTAGKIRDCMNISV